MIEYISNINFEESGNLQLLVKMTNDWEKELNDYLFESFPESQIEYKNCDDVESKIAIVIVSFDINRNLIVEFIDAMWKINVIKNEINKIENFIKEN